jgi:hypothetical protein
MEKKGKTAVVTRTECVESFIMRLVVTGNSVLCTAEVGVEPVLLELKFMQLVSV